jgi:hypothetical protein
MDPRQAPYETSLSTVGKVMQAFYALDTGSLVQLQARLVAAGQLDPCKFVPGQPDNATEKAYADVVKRSAFSGRSILSILDESTKAVQAMGGIDALAKSKRAPLSLDLSNPNDLRRVVMAGAEKVYGHANVDEATIQRIIGAVQSQQAAEQTAKYNGAGAVTQAADPSTTAQNMLEQADPQAAATEQYRSYGDEVFKLLAGGASK